MNSILDKIIENEGSCTMWANSDTCAQCPLAKLRRKADGTYLSCVEALGVQDMTESEADARYKEVAARLLMDEAIEDLLVDGNDGTH